VSSVFPEFGKWVVPDAAKAATLDGVRPAGICGNESGAFWLGVRAEVAETTVVVLPHGKGVEESAGHWIVGAEVFGVISRWAKPRGLALIGIVHTHPPGVPPRLSWADRHRSVRAPGILAIVIGNSGRDEDHHDWGWYVYEGDDYRRLLRPELIRRIQGSAKAIEVWRADREGVWAK
jgi:hypothetical protein